MNHIYVYAVVEEKEKKRDLFVFPLLQQLNLDSVKFAGFMNILKNPHISLLA